jgi:alpha-L-fucosidase
VPEKAQATLKGVGAWMKVNSEAIYGTTASPFARLPWGRATQKPGVLYLMVFDWPVDGRLVVPMKGAVKTARLLGGGEVTAGPSDTESGRLVVSLPTRPVDESCSVVKLELASGVEPMAYLVFPSADGVLTLTPHDATLEGPSIRVEKVGDVGDVKYNVGYWLDPAATATWPIGIGFGQRGEFAVEADLGCADAAAGAKMRLEFEGGSANLEFTVTATGGWQQYRTVELGSVTLPEGSHRVVLRALNKPGEAVVNVRAIRLKKR